MKSIPRSRQVCFNGDVSCVPCLRRETMSCTRQRSRSDSRRNRQWLCVFLCSAPSSICENVHQFTRPPVSGPTRLPFFPPPSSLERRVQFPLLEYSKQEGHKRANSQLRLGRQQVLRNMDEKWGNIPMDTNFGSCIIESAMIVACLTDVSIRPSPVFLK